MSPSLYIKGLGHTLGCDGRNTSRTVCDEPHSVCELGPVLRLVGVPRVEERGRTNFRDPPLIKTLTGWTVSKCLESLRHELGRLNLVSWVSTGWEDPLGQEGGFEGRSSWGPLTL